MHRMNLAFMAKIGWRLISEKESLWTQVLTGKYIRGEPNATTLIKKNGASDLWQGIVVAAHIISTGLRNKVYNGEDTLFWRDTWLCETPLLNLALQPLSSAESYKKVEKIIGHQMTAITGICYLTSSLPK